MLRIVHGRCRVIRYRLTQQWVHLLAHILNQPVMQAGVGMDMDTEFNYLTLMGVCLFGAMSPGPSLMVILGVASEYGSKAGVLCSWAHALGVGLWAALSVSTWYLLTDDQSALSSLIRSAVLLIASFYLIYVSIKIFRQLWLTMRLKRDAPSRSEENLPRTQSPDIETRRVLSAGKAGLSIAVANPKLLVFFSAIYPQVLPSQLSLFQLLTAVTIPILIDGLWYHFVTLFSGRLGLLRAIQKYQNVTQGVMASLLLMIGVSSLIAYYQG